MKLHSAFRLSFFCGAALLAASCANKEEVYVERPVEALYNEAVDFMQQEKYASAAKAFDEVERQHPYSVWATNAQIQAAYANYLNKKYDDAIIALDRFISLHPGHKSAPYAYYLKSLSYYEQISDVGRDQKITDLAMKSLDELIARFPTTSYARDARVKIDLTRDHLAGKEMEIGRYYLKQNQYLAAMNRFRNVVATYQTTTHVPEALHRLVECYLALGLKAEAHKTAALLGHNYPGSEWYIDSYEFVEDTKFRTEKKSSWLPW
jgi:outer membrane protein assembly factor BamD